MKLTVSIIEGYDKGKKQLFTEFPISIGRLSDSDFQISDPFVSRRHCTVYMDDTFLWVSDLNSTNKTYLNDQLLNSPKTILDGDKLIIGINILKLNLNM